MPYECTKKYISEYHNALKKSASESIALNKRILANAQDPLADEAFGRFLKGLYVAPGIGAYNEMSHTWENPVISIIHHLKEDGVSHQQLGAWCGNSGPLITKWKNAESKPGKYAWWSIAIHTGMHVKYLESFLLMAGHSFDPQCRQDQILFYAQLHSLSTMDICIMMERHGCLTPEIRAIFA